MHHLKVTAAVGLVVTLACSESRPGGETTPDDTTFDVYFSEVGAVTLAEPPGAPLADVSAVALLTSDQLVIVDRPSHQARIHGPDGSLHALFGGYGQGPGELADPTDVAVGQDGRIFVTEFGNSRVSVFDSHGVFDTTFAVDDRIPYSIDSHNAGLLIGTHADIGPLFAVTSLAGDLEQWLYEREDRLRLVPYWGSVNREYATATRTGAIVASSLLYRTHFFDSTGSFVTSVGAPPSEWEEASEPKMGDFVGTSGNGRLRRWLADFTILTGLYSIDDSLFAVSRGVFGAALGETSNQADLLRVHSRELDLYHLDGRRVATGIPLPGEVLASDGRGRLIVLASTPPSGWVLRTYELRGSPP